AGERVRARALFAPESELVRTGVIGIGEPGDPLIARPLKLDDRIVDYLLQVHRPDPRIAPSSRFEDLLVPEEVVSHLQAFLRRHAAASSPDTLAALFYIHGPAGSDTRRLAEAACTELGVTLLAVEAGSLLESREAFEHSFRRLVREAALIDAAVCLEG